MEKTKKRATSDLDVTFPEFLEEQSVSDIMRAQDSEKPALKPAWATVNLPRKLTFREKPTKRVFYDYSEVDNAINLLERLPSPGETVHAVMDSHFKGIDLVPAILRLAGVPASELIVTTLGFNRRDAACLCELVQRGEIHRLSMVCSNFFAEKDKGAYDYALGSFADFGPTHFYTVESSANLRSCNNFEQFALTNSPELFAFHRSWVSKML